MADSHAEHKPFVPPETVIPEFTWRAVITGTLLGIIFGASSLYLVLKIGMTVSASIPVAVLSITLFRILAKVAGLRPATILENNIVQTAGSAGESLAFGVGVTMPALLLLGFEMTVGRVMTVAVLGGMLGILMMIPLRRVFIVQKHKELKYPEGTACADVLVVGETGGTSAKTVFVGFGLAFVFHFLMLGTRLWKDVVAYPLKWYRGATVSLEASAILLGVGYILGPRISSIMVAGGVLASLVLTPTIRMFGDTAPEPIAPATSAISTMSDAHVTHEYVLYIGAGAVAAGGIISLVQALPLIVGSIVGAFRDLRRTGSTVKSRIRTDRDLSMVVVVFGSLALVAVIAATYPLKQAFPEQLDWMPELFTDAWSAAAGSLLIVVFGALFVTVSSRLTGEVGSSSNPISGMTVATLLLTCFIFFYLGKTGDEQRLAALTIAAIVCVAASNGGTTSQDLKTGYLVGATPRAQQFAILIGAVSSALVIGVILVALNQAHTVYTRKDLPTPKTPIDVAALTAEGRTPLRETPRGGDQALLVWHARAGNPQDVPPGKYLISDSGQIEYLVDPAVNGRIRRTDEGIEVMRFDAPKTRLFALITDGILTQKLPWTLVLIGVSIAIVLELCGVPSLPFAVGVYLPLAVSAPIFVGGVTRWFVDRFLRRGVPDSELEAEMSPGVLLSTGYIAGGSIAGVLVAFCAFSDDLPEIMAYWQHRTVAVDSAATIDEQATRAARAELGLPDTTPTEPSATTDEEQRRRNEEAVAELAAEIKELNADQLKRYSQAPAGTRLRLGGGKEEVLTESALLKDLAKKYLGRERKAGSLTEINPEIPVAAALPEGAPLKIPQGNTLALSMFGALVAILIAVGGGWVLRDKGREG